MEFLHTDFQGGRDHVVLTTLDREANVMLLDDGSFEAYRTGRGFRYYGGWVSHSPVRLQPPHHGHWHVVIDLGGGAGVVRASIRVVEINRQLNPF